MLESYWDFFFYAGMLLTTFGLIRFLYQWKKTDSVDALLLGFAASFDLITAGTASSIDFVCSTPSTLCVNGLQTYTGNYFLIGPFYAIGIILLFLFIFSFAIILANLSPSRRQKFRG